MSDLAKAQSLFFSALQAQGRSDLNSAEQLYREALRLVPGRSSIVKNLAAVLLESAKFDEASELCAGHLQSHPDDFAVWTQLGNTQLGMGQFERALESYTTALGMTPNHIETLINNAYALESLGRLQEALEYLNRTLALAPENAAALGNRGNVLAKLTRFQDALLDFKLAQNIAPSAPMPYWNESICRLFFGDFEGGWKLYDWGWKAKQRGRKPVAITQPRWNGMDYVDKLLVWGEQGIGDQILFGSMLEELRKYAKQIVVAADPRLLTLFRRAYPDFDFTDVSSTKILQYADQQIAMGDLGQFFRRGWHDFPKRKNRLLTPDPEDLQLLRKRLGNGEELVCGFSWSSNNPRIGPFKSLDKADLSRLGAIRGVRWVDLQYGDTHQDRTRFLEQFGLNITHFDDIDNFNDIDRLAALISSCDIVVSVSNTTAHLAGALGVPTVVVLPETIGRLWYWHHGASSSPWYPSCSLVRQSAPGEWAQVIENVRSRIDELIKARTNCRRLE